MPEVDVVVVCHNNSKIWTSVERENHIMAHFSKNTNASQYWFTDRVVYKYRFVGKLQMLVLI